MRTFFRFIVAVVALVVAMAWPGWSQPVVTPPVAPTMTSADSLVAIDLLTRKIAAANPGYPDPYKVPIGATIYVPTGTGVMVPYKTESWHLGQRGCFWQVAAYHLYGVRSVTPPDTAKAVVPAPVAEASTFSLYDALKHKYFGIPLWAFLIFGIAVAGAAEYYRRRERQLDPRRDPPVVRGGLSEDPEQALRQVQAATTIHHGPNRQVVSVQRGTLRSTDGRRRSFITRVEFGDGIIRRKRLEEGMICWQVVVNEEGQEHTEYWLNHCGNRVAERKDGRFELPDGWEFVPEPGVTAHLPEADQIAAAAEAVHDEATARAEANGHEYRVTLQVQNGNPNPTVYTITSEGGRYIKGFEVTKGGTMRVDM